MIDAKTIKAALACGRSGCTCTLNGKTHCVGHDDTRPSLKVTQSGDRVLVHCHAGCTQEAVIAALQERELWPRAETAPVIPPARKSASTGTWRVVKEWAYPNDGSAPRAYHGREEDGTEDGDGKPNKLNRWRLPTGTYDEGLKGALTLAELPLYNAHLLAKYPEAGAILVEGEQAASAAVEHGLIAVSLCGGAGQRNFGAALAVLKDRDVWLWPDAKDEPSTGLMAAVKAQLPHARYVNVPADMPPKGDAVEYFALGHAVGELFVRPLRSRSLPDFLAGGVERRPDVAGPVVAAGITYLFGGVGEGKTALATEIAASKASGVSRIGLTATPGRVLIVQADMAEPEYRDYVRDVLGDRDDAARDNLRIWMAEGALYLDEPEDADMLRDEVRDFRPELVILDHLSTLIASDGYGTKELRPALDTISAIRREGVAVLVLDQVRKESNNPNGNRAPSIDNLIGGRAKSAIADRAWHIRKDQASGVFTLTPAKQRGISIAPISMAFGDDGWELVEQGQLSRHTPAEAQVLTWIASAPEGLPRTLVDVQELTHLSPRTVKDAKARLLYLGEIVHAGYRGRAKTYKCAPTAEGGK